MIEENAVPNDVEVEKITVRLSGEAMKRVRALAAAKGITINEFMRRAVSTEAFLVEQSSKGARILLQDDNDKVREVVFP